MWRIIVVLLSISLLSCQEEEKIVIEEPKTLDGRMGIGSQRSLEEFAKEGYEVITGRLAIGGAGSDIVDLTPLSNLKRVGSLEIAQTRRLKSLKGLENLQIEESLSFYENDSLTTLLPLQNLKDSLYIWIQGPFTDLDALWGITYAESISIGGFQGYDLIGLSRLKSAEWVSIYKSHNLYDLTGLQNLESVYRLRIDRNNNLRSLKGLNSLQSTVEKVEFIRNENLSNFCDLHPGVWADIYTKSNKYNPLYLQLDGGECSD